jgi:outer membrane protein assembly factor BamD (BamD/ComL family)
VTYRNDEVIALTKNLVNVKVNADKDTLLKAQYGVAGYPTIVLAKSDGTEIDRIFGYAEPTEFMATINDYLADRNTLADYLRRAEAEPTMKMFAMIADKYTGRSKFADAETYYNKIIQADPENKQGYSDSAMFWIGQMKTRAKKYAEAEATFVQFRATYPQSGLAEDALFEVAKARRGAEKYDDAVAGFREFLKTYPQSKLAEDAEIYIAFCYDKKGDKDEALRLYKKFLTDHPKSGDSTWVQKQINNITNPPPAEGKK